MTCDLKITDCLPLSDDERPVDGNLICVKCYVKLMPYSPSGRLLDGEVSTALRNMRQSRRVGAGTTELIDRMLGR